jgi:uncharacterized repeat protein (TIGR01451 family)
MEMMTAYAGLRSRWARVAMLTMVVAAASGGLAETAQAETWANEHDLSCDTRPGVRGTFIFDPGACNSIPQERFAQDPAFVNYYGVRGFDRNFLTWAPTHVISPGAAPWSDCGTGTPHPGAFCPVGTGFHPFNAVVTNNQLTAREYNGAFIAVICGNYSQSGTSGPIPHISGTKFEDRNGNFVRDGGEPGLGGVRITLIRDGVDITSTTTAGDGSYDFPLDVNANANQGPGTYTLREDVPAGFRQTRTPGAIGVGYAIGAHNFTGNDFGNERLTDIVVDKTALKPVTIAGEDLQWALTVTSRGLFATPDVVVEDDVPTAVADILDVDPACTRTGLQLRCALGTMAPGEVRVLHFRTPLPPNLDPGRHIENCADVTSSYRDSNPADNHDCAETVVDTRANLVTTKAVSTTEADGGSPISYTITVRNNGPSDARAVTLDDPVAPDVAILSVVADAGTCTVVVQSISCAFGILVPGASRTVTVTGRAKGTPPVFTDPTHGDHQVTVGKKSDQMSLRAGETVTQTVQCEPGWIATDGSTRVASVDQGTGDPTSIKVLESRAVALGTYRFTVRNDASGRAQVQLFVVCLSPTTSVNNGHLHALVTQDPVSSTRTLPVGPRQTITVAVPLDYRAIAPGFVVTSGKARLIASEPTADGWALTFNVTEAAGVTAAVRPLQRRVSELTGVAGIPNHSHELGLRHIEKTVTVPAHGTLETSLSCADDEKGIVKSFDFDGITGDEPQPKIRVFRLYNPTSAVLPAALDLECLANRTSGGTDEQGLVVNTATAASSTVDPDPTDNAASATFVVYRALGSAGI